MAKVKDKKRGHLWQYRWRSETSLMADYIFEKIMGFSERGLTTYDKLNALWVKYSSKGFKRGFIQGVCDSDGCKIHLLGRYLRIHSYPNSELIRETLIGLLGFENGIKLREIPKMGTRVKIVWIRNTKRLKDIFNIPMFSPHVNSYRYKLLKAYTEAQTFQKVDKKKKQEIRREIKDKLLKGVSLQHIVESILCNHKIRMNSDVINTLKSKLGMKNASLI